MLTIHIINCWRSHRKLNKILAIEDNAGVLQFGHEDIAVEYCKDFPKSKCPGPDGLISEFFLDSWNITGEDVCKGISHFFRLVNTQESLILPPYLLCLKIRMLFQSIHFDQYHVATLFASD